jgi:hypothetical protein
MRTRTAVPIIHTTSLVKSDINPPKSMIPKVGVSEAGDVP